MEKYVGLDVSLNETSLCVVDQTGTTLWQGKCASTPESIAAVLARRAPGATRIGLESGLLSTWHWPRAQSAGSAGIGPLWLAATLACIGHACSDAVDDKVRNCLRVLVMVLSTALVSTNRLTARSRLNRLVGVPF